MRWMVGLLLLVGLLSCSANGQDGPDETSPAGDSLAPISTMYFLEGNWYWETPQAWEQFADAVSEEIESNSVAVLLPVGESSDLTLLSARLDVSKAAPINVWKTRLDLSMDYGGAQETVFVNSLLANDGLSCQERLLNGWVARVIRGYEGCVFKGINGHTTFEWQESGTRFNLSTQLDEAVVLAWLNGWTQVAP